jgi:hypothetical protein
LSVDGVELKCRYDFVDHRCRVYRADLSLKTIGSNFTFSGTQEKKETTVIAFLDSGRVAHFPRNLFKEFPKLNELSIWSSDIPILRNNFFKPEFSKLRKLQLVTNKIRIIQENAFEHLTNLEWIDLQYNRIKMIAPGTFRNLHQLKVVDLWQNECINAYIGCRDCDRKLNQTELDLKLQPCFDNYKKSSNLLNEGENTFFCEIITSQVVGDDEIIPNFY